MSRLLPNRIPTYQELKEIRHISNLEETEFFEQLCPFIHRLLLSSNGTTPLEWNVQDYHINLYISWLMPDYPDIGDLVSVFTKLANCLEVLPSSLRLNNYHEYSDIENKGNWIAFSYTGLANTKILWQIILYCFCHDTSVLPIELSELTKSDLNKIDLGVGLNQKSRDELIDTSSSTLTGLP